MLGLVILVKFLSLIFSNLILVIGYLVLDTRIRQLDLNQEKDQIFSVFIFMRKEKNH